MIRPRARRPKARTPVLPRWWPALATRLDRQEELLIALAETAQADRATMLGILRRLPHDPGAPQ